VKILSLVAFQKLVDTGCRLKAERVQALLFVSRAVWGNRQIACALLQGVDSVPVQGSVAASASESASLAAASAAVVAKSPPTKLLEESAGEGAYEGSERGTVRTMRTAVSSIGGAIPLFRVDGRSPT